MELARTIPAITDQIDTEYQSSQRCAQDAVQHAINVGILLREAKKLVGHGEWLGYLEDNFEFGHSMASNYMKLAEHQDRITDSNFQRAGNLSVREALKLITSDSPKRERKTTTAVPVEIIPLDDDESAEEAVGCDDTEELRIEPAKEDVEGQQKNEKFNVDLHISQMQREIQRWFNSAPKRYRKNLREAIAAWAELL